MPEPLYGAHSEHPRGASDRTTAELGRATSTPRARAVPALSATSDASMTPKGFAAAAEAGPANAAPISAREATRDTCLTANLFLNFTVSLDSGGVLVTAG